MNDDEQIITGLLIEQGNSLGNSGAEWMCELLKTNTTLIDLNLNCNDNLLNLNRLYLLKMDKNSELHRY